MTKISFDSNGSEKLKINSEDAAEALKCLECNEKVRNTTLKMLEHGLIEIYRCLENPKEIKILLTEKGKQFFASLNQ